MLSCTQFGLYLCFLWLFFKFIDDEAMMAPRHRKQIILYLLHKLWSDCILPLLSNLLSNLLPNLWSNLQIGLIKQIEVLHIQQIRL